MTVINIFMERKKKNRTTPEVKKTGKTEYENSENGNNANAYTQKSQFVCVA